jgi:pimeloyl-ACP methyl ester carboxylesterase
VAARAGELADAGVIDAPAEELDAHADDDLDAEMLGEGKAVQRLPLLEAELGAHGLGQSFGVGLKPGRSPSATVTTPSPAACTFDMSNTVRSTSEGSTMNAAPTVLVPGFWLGAWAWDEVADALRSDGHDVTALTLPGLESADADRSSITLSDHVDAICDAVRAAGRPIVLAVHSATGFSGYAASDRLPEQVAAIVYVDSAPGKGAMDPEFADAEKPMVWEEVAEEENLDGLSEEQKETFRQRAVPVPGGVLREGVELTNDARRDIPSTIICTGYTSDQYKEAVEQGYSWLAGVPELRNVTWVDLPTSHWPMWSRPKELAAIIGDVAKGAA